MSKEQVSLNEKGKTLIESHSKQIASANSNLKTGA